MKPSSKNYILDLLWLSLSNTTICFVIWNKRPNTVSHHYIYTQEVRDCQQHVKLRRRWGTAAAGHTGCHSCQLINRKLRLQFAWTLNWYNRRLETWKSAVTLNQILCFVCTVIVQSLAFPGISTAMSGWFDPNIHSININMGIATRSLHIHTHFSFKMKGDACCALLCFVVCDHMTQQCWADSEWEHDGRKKRRLLWNYFVAVNENTADSDACRKDFFCYDNILYKHEKLWK